MLGSTHLPWLAVALAALSGGRLHSADRCDSGISAARRAVGAPVVQLNASPASNAGMTWIRGGEFWMGSDHTDMYDARPVHRVALDGFWIDRTEVTNDEFAAFIAATGYVTVAERQPDPKDFPDAKPEDLVPGSAVFARPIIRCLWVTLTSGGAT
jgi:formylglycine-generating enzyme required for sulfatase activity